MTLKPKPSKYISKDKRQVSDDLTSDFLKQYNNTYIIYNNNADDLLAKPALEYLSPLHIEHSIILLIIIYDSICILN